MGDTDRRQLEALDKDRFVLLFAGKNDNGTTQCGYSCAKTFLLRPKDLSRTRAARKSISKERNFSVIMVFIVGAPAFN